jgi:hypothetical protein
MIPFDHFNFFPSIYYSVLVISDCLVLHEAQQTYLYSSSRTPTITTVLQEFAVGSRYPLSTRHRNIQFYQILLPSLCHRYLSTCNIDQPTRSAHWARWHGSMHTTSPSFTEPREIGPTFSSFPTRVSAKVII